MFWMWGGDRKNMAKLGREKNKGRKEKGGMGQLLNAEEHCWKETWRGVKG